LAAEAARERHGEVLSEADLEVHITALPPGLPRPTDVLSGGTIQSMVAVMGGESERPLADPASLVEDPALAEEIRHRSPLSVWPRRGEGGAVLAPMAPAAFINPPVIQRTAALLADEQGERRRPPRYREGTAMAGSPATLPLRAAAAGVLSGTQALLGAAAAAPPAARRRVSGTLGRVLPSSGFGPPEDRLEAWRWEMRLRAGTPAGRELRVNVEGEGHPGYLATSRMLGEAGLLLAEDGATPERAGCLTPATALGTKSIERFDRARLRFRLR